MQHLKSGTYTLSLCRILIPWWILVGWLSRIAHKPLRVSGGNRIVYSNVASKPPPTTTHRRVGFRNFAEHHLKDETHFSVFFFVVVILSIQSGFTCYIYPSSVISVKLIITQTKQGPVLLTFLRHVARISANGIAAFKESCSPIG